MKLSIKNLAKIKQADIELDGLTVIAGDNDTGKSTVGKALYAMFNGFRNMTSNVHSQRCRSLSNAIFNVVTTYEEFPYQKPSILGTAVESFELGELLKKEHELTLDLVMEKSRAFIKEKYTFDLIYNEEKLSELIQRLEKIFQIDDKEIACQIVGEMYNEVFQHQSNSLSGESVAEIQMNIKNQKIRSIIKNNICTDVNIEFNLNHGAAYIDNPFVIDRLSKEYYGYDAVMMNSLEQRLRKKQSIDLVTNIVNNKTLHAVMSIIDDVVPGTFVEIDNTFSLMRPEWKEPLNVANLSTGVKSFAIFKLLLQNHQLQEKDVIILDEPEIHLHPDWQVKYAEFLVLFQKAFNLTILLTTHSPYFLNAIEVYTKQYDSMESLKVYKTKSKDVGVLCNDVTDDLEKVYASMSKPFEKMAQLEDKLEMRE